VGSIVLSVIGNYIYERTFSEDVVVIVNTDEVIIEQGGDRIIVPRHVYDATKTAEMNPAFRSAMSKAFEAVGSDDTVSAFGIAESMDSPKPKVLIPRERLYAAATITNTERDERVITEEAVLYIVKAVLEKGRRKWEFNWQGFRINAAVTHIAFHERFARHEITIAPGDQLRTPFRMSESHALL